MVEELIEIRQPELDIDIDYYKECIKREINWIYYSALIVKYKNKKTKNHMTFDNPKQPTYIIELSNLLLLLLDWFYKNRF